MLDIILCNNGLITLQRSRLANSVHATVLLCSSLLMTGLYCHLNATICMNFVLFPLHRIFVLTVPISLGHCERLSGVFATYLGEPQNTPPRHVGSFVVVLQHSCLLLHCPISSIDIYKTQKRRVTFL
jgi:hypothetical protein